MIHLDRTAGFARAGFFGSKYRFSCSKAYAMSFLNKKQMLAVAAEQSSTPVQVLWYNGRVWWLFNNEFYWDDEGLTAYQVKALALERQRKRDRRIERAVAAMEGSTAAVQARRERIPESVQSLVWNRDGGRCVRCGSSERLEFDHIIPVARGGGNTARNLQLLCESCNRSKGVGGLTDFSQSPQVAPAGWHPDPHERHQLRYWDGSRWTSHVSDSGVASRDDV